MLLSDCICTPKHAQTRWVILPSEQNVLGICLNRSWTVWWSLKYYNQKHFGRKGYLSQERPSLREVPEGTQAAPEPEGRNKRRPWGALSIGLPNVAYFLIPPRTTHPGMASSTVDWVLHYQSSVKKMAYRLVHRPFWWGHFLNWGFLFLNEFYHQVPGSSKQPITLAPENPTLSCGLWGYLNSHVHTHTHAYT